MYKRQLDAESGNKSQPRRTSEQVRGRKGLTGEGTPREEGLGAVILPEDRDATSWALAFSGPFRLPGEKTSRKGDSGCHRPYVGGLVWEGLTQWVPFQSYLFKLQPFHLSQLPGGLLLGKMWRTLEKESQRKRDTHWPPPSLTGTFSWLLSPLC